MCIVGPQTNLYVFHANEITILLRGPSQHVALFGGGAGIIISVTMTLSVNSCSNVKA